MHGTPEQMKLLAKITGVVCPACDDSKTEEAEGSEDEDESQVEIKTMSKKDKKAEVKRLQAQIKLLTQKAAESDCEESEEEMWMLNMLDQEGDAIELETLEKTVKYMANLARSSGKEPSGGLSASQVYIMGNLALELYAGMVQRFEHNGDTPEAGTKGEVTHER